jgi:putative DNA primase/helicase
LESGLLNVRTRRLFPHSPEFLSTIRVPIAFDKEAACPEIEKFVGEVCPEDAIPLAWEIHGDLLTPDRSVQKTICLLGEGGNGKSVFLDLASRFVGTENVCHLSLQGLEAVLFGRAALPQAGKHLSRPAGRAFGEAITGCDRITAEVKYRDSFEFAPFVRLLFSANRLPASSDASQAFFDRWLIVPFQSGFCQTRREVPRRILQWRSCSPTELSGALNKALDGLERVRKCFRFTEP